MKRFVFISWAAASLPLGVWLAIIVARESKTAPSIPEFAVIVVMYPIVIFICGWLLALGIASLKEMAKEKGLRSFALDCKKEFMEGLKGAMKILLVAALGFFLLLSPVFIDVFFPEAKDKIAEFAKNPCKKGCAAGVAAFIGSKVIKPRIR